MVCELCGTEFEKGDAACGAGCPLSGGCGLVCCPACGYQAVDASSSLTVRLARRAWQALSLRPRAEDRR